MQLPSGLGLPMTVLFSVIPWSTKGLKLTINLNMGIYWVTVAIHASHFLWPHIKPLQILNRKHLTKPTARQEWPLSKPLVDGSGASTYYILSAAWYLKRCALLLVLVQCCTTFPFFSTILLMMTLLMMTNLTLFLIMGLIKAGYYEITFATHFSKSFIVSLPVGKKILLRGVRGVWEKLYSTTILWDLP